MVIIIFSAFVVPLLKDINHPELLKECKINPDAAAYEKNIDANLSKLLIKNKLIFMIATCPGLQQ